MNLKRELSKCQEFERFWQESLDAPRPRWDEYWFDVAWADHLATCDRCRARNQRYRRLAQALELWRPEIGEVPDLSESSLRLWKKHARPALNLNPDPSPSTSGKRSWRATLRCLLKRCFPWIRKSDEL